MIEADVVGGGGGGGGGDGNDGGGDLWGEVLPVRVLTWLRTKPTTVGLPSQATACSYHALAQAILGPLQPLPPSPPDTQILEHSSCSASMLRCNVDCHASKSGIIGHPAITLSKSSGRDFSDSQVLGCWCEEPKSSRPPDSLTDQFSSGLPCAPYHLPPPQPMASTLILLTCYRKCRFTLRD